jgi:hypothetical protein
MSTSSVQSDQQAEIERLRARVAALERELVEQAERTARVVAEAQERTYWLDRWHLDLNALMRRRGAGEARALIRLLRGAARAAKRAKRALLGES